MGGGDHELVAVGVGERGTNDGAARNDREGDGNVGRGRRGPVAETVGRGEVTDAGRNSLTLLEEKRPLTRSAGIVS